MAMFRMDTLHAQALAPAATTGGIPNLLPTLDASQCAELLHCSKATVEALADRGELPATKFGRGWVFVTGQILALLQARSEAEAAQRRAQREPAPSAPSSRVQPALHAPSTPGRARKVPPPLPGVDHMSSASSEPRSAM